MAQEAEIEKIEINSLGEIRMGCDAYGIVIRTNFGTLEILKETPILIGHTDHSKCITQSECRGYVLIEGAFSTYIFDIKRQALSLYKVTIRGANNEWSEEQAIFGQETAHISGFSRHYYLQFPFVKLDLFFEVLRQYEALRKRQIAEAVSAL